MKKRSCVVGLAVMMGGLALLAAGCEKTVTSMALEVTPESSVVEVRGAVHLTASISDSEREVYYPLEWSVRDGALGSIGDAAGDTAVYYADHRAGVNSVIVRDQMGAEGVAVIKQVAPVEAD